MFDGLDSVMIKDCVQNEFLKSRESEKGQQKLISVFSSFFAICYSTTDTTHNPASVQCNGLSVSSLPVLFRLTSERCAIKLKLTEVILSAVEVCTLSVHTCYPYLSY